MKNIIIDSLTLLKNNPYPTYVWGGSFVSHRITRFYRSQGIDIKANLISKEYFLPEEFIDGTKTICFESFWDQQKNPVNLIVGFKSASFFKLNEIDDDKIEELVVADFSSAFTIPCETLNIFSKEFWKNHKEDILSFRYLLKDKKSVTHLDSWIFQKRTSVRWKTEYDENPYFDSDVIKYMPEEVFVDCGAYHGEDTENFIKQAKVHGVTIEKIFICEPNKQNIDIIKRRIKNISQAVFIQKGLGSEVGTLSFSATKNGMFSVDPNGESDIPIDTIDNILKNTKASFIKMDIEGSELSALHGAINQIKLNRPKLSISLYHRRDDIVTIPKFLLSLVPDYNFYFRNYSSTGNQAVLYAI